jgi:hypothetical protein
VSICSETCIVPNSTAKALPMRPATTIAVTTGLSSLEKAKAKTPPTELFNPNLVNSLTNCIVNAMPTKAEVKRHTATNFGPTLRLQTKFKQNKEAKAKSSTLRLIK